MAKKANLKITGMSCATKIEKGLKSFDRSRKWYTHKWRRTSAEGKRYMHYDK